ncbi:methylated-DNA--[protein]-cysteine S-methyltransferase [Paenibacillus sp. LMG 31459]|uniref:Methylated-DNA--protein-cysteine methyltransferase n=1 Tax=Paenibacillus phytohabitans TaxID=2654978 RepID=A0ABX1Y9A1_9BACL|nr:methylated-DNA--[protein]-cysteine S-methyltransferase [Paenibacillus phytohabitans]
MNHRLESSEGAEASLYYKEIDSIIGPLTLCATASGLCMIKFGTYEANSATIAAWVKMQLGPAAQIYADAGSMSEAERQLAAYFSGELQSFSVPLDMRGTDFQRQVWEALLSVPYGESASYKDIAVMIGNPQAVRAVGGANNRNPVPVIVPCHRIIGAGGTLVGYAGGLGIKSRLLQLEAEQAGPGLSGNYLF